MNNLNFEEFVKKLSETSFYSIEESKCIANIVIGCNGKLSIAYDSFEKGGSCILNQYLDFLKLKINN